jgi:prevent-host-death family protein
MTLVGSHEVTTRFPELLERVTRGEKVLITEGGKPVAVLSPPSGEDDVRRVIEEFMAYSRQQGRTLAGLSPRELIEEGRRF